MAGLFGFFDYNRPGPGVPKDAPPKSPFIVFFEILQRKFWNLIRINMMFLVFNLPALLAGMFVMISFFPNIFPDAMDSPEKLLMDTIMKFVLLTVMMCIPMITVGPAQAGFTYILRNYSREEHAFIWGDFKDAARNNFKQSLIVSTINFFVTFLTLISIRAYWILLDAGQIAGLPGTIGLAVMIVMLLVFASMNLYIYPIMVTFDLTLKQLYINSLIFAVIKFIPNVGILLLSAFLVLLSFGLIIPFNPLIGLIPYILITTSLIGFLTNFYAYPKLKKYMLSKVEQEADEEDEEEDEDDEEEEETAELIAEDDKETSENQSDYADGVVGDDGVKRYF